uniref:Uncharacterized protein n=1 Tax=Anguilla anguilla TaxID=7936 RepID=A0A0E9PDW9_ANGAN
MLPRPKETDPMPLCLCAKSAEKAAAYLHKVDRLLGKISSWQRK